MKENFLLESYKEDVTKLNDFVNFNKERELDLAIKIQNEKNRDIQSKYVGELISPHLSYVVRVASKLYHNQDFPREVLDLNDFISWGNEGLIKAAHKYNPDKNVRFLSYAKNWVEQVIKERVSKYKLTMYQPINRHIKNYQSKRVADNFYQKNGFDPQIGDTLIYTTSNNTTVDIDIKQYIPQQFSFDDPVKEGDSTTFSDILYDEDSDEMDCNISPIMETLNDIFNKNTFTLKEKYIFYRNTFDEINIEDFTKFDSYVYMFCKYPSKLECIVKRDKLAENMNLFELRKYVGSKEFRDNVQLENFVVDTPQTIRAIKKSVIDKLQILSFKFKDYL